MASQEGVHYLLVSLAKLQEAGQATIGVLSLLLRCAAGHARVGDVHILLQQRVACAINRLVLTLQHAG